MPVDADKQKHACFLLLIISSLYTGTQAHICISTTTERLPRMLQTFLCLLIPLSISTPLFLLLSHSSHSSLISLHSFPICILYMMKVWQTGSVDVVDSNTNPFYGWLSNWERSIWPVNPFFLMCFKQNNCLCCTNNSLDFLLFVSSPATQWKRRHQSRHPVTRLRTSHRHRWCWKSRLNCRWLGSL